MRRRVVITAVGLISPLGNSPDEVMEGIGLERVCFERSPILPDVSICPVKNFDLSSFIGRFKNKRYLNRGGMFAVAAASEAVRRAGLGPGETAETGLFAGAGPNLEMEGLPRGVEEHEKWKRAPALWMLKFLPNTAASSISQILGVHGENFTAGAACAASLTAIGEAFRKVRDGYLEGALAGGGDSRLGYSALMAYKKAGALSLNALSPEAAILPFDRARRGFVPGEGGAFFMLETMERAKRRDTEILAEICGYGCSMDGGSMTAPAPDGKQAESAVKRALADADVQADEIDLISAHATGTLLNDAVEADMIRRIFTKSRPMVTALKSWTGHGASACGALELAVCLGIMKSGLVPEIRNLEAPCLPELNFVRETRYCDVKNILLQNFGFGGQNCILVIRAWERGQNRRGRTPYASGSIFNHP